jgi:hypothetical protein
MRRLRECVEGLFDGSAVEILRRLRVVLVTLRVDLIAPCAEQCRGEQLCGRAQQISCEVDHRGRCEAQLACGRLVRVSNPRCCPGACDIFWVRL